MSTIGFALSGGGSKISFHLGALEVLSDHGITPTVVSGTSAGALAGLTVAAGRLDLLRRELDTIDSFDDIYSGGVRRFAWNLAKWKIGIGDSPLGLFDTRPLRRRIQRVVQHIDHLDAVFYPVRVMLETGSVEVQTVLDRAVLDVLASASIPILAEPVRRNGDHWIDGGTRDFSPISTVVERHAIDALYVLNTQTLDVTDRSTINDFVDVVQETVDIMTGEIFRNDLRGLTDWNDVARQAEEKGVTITHPRRNRPIKHIDATIIEPAAPLPPGTDFSRDAIEAGIASGRTAARAVLPPA